MLYFVGPVRKKIKRLESNQQNTKSRVGLVEDGMNVVEEKVNVVEGTMNVVKNTVLNLQGTHTRRTTKGENNQMTLTLRKRAFTVKRRIQCSDISLPVCKRLLCEELPCSTSSTKFTKGWFLQKPSFKLRLQLILHPQGENLKSIAPCLLLALLHFRHRDLFELLPSCNVLIPEKNL